MPDLIRKISAMAFAPTLAIIQVGKRDDSTAFIKAKKSFARKIGAKELHLELTEKISQKELIDEIEKYNKDPTIQGIIVQLPLPKDIDRDAVIAAISPEKDADGFLNQKITPATARGIRELLRFYNISLKGKKITVIGRSQMVGTPIAEMCRKEGAEVTVCHRGTENVAEKCRAADVIISAAGVPKLIGIDHVKSGQIVIDVGITSIGGADLDKKILAGDVDFETVKEIAEGISPVPGGVGPMTVFALFENLADLSIAAKGQKG